MSNFNGGVASGDVELTIDLWVNELSDLIVHSPEKVVDLLNKTKVTASKEDTNEQIIDKILNNIGNNTKLNRGISFLIGEQNNLVNKSNNDDWKTNIDVISEKYQTLLKGVLDNPTLKASVKTDLMQHIKSKVESTGKNERVVFSAAVDEQKKKKNKTMLYVVGGVLLLTAIGVGIYLYKKHKNKLSFEGGGDLSKTTTPPVTPTPVVASVVAAPVAKVVPPVTVAPVTAVTPTPVVQSAPVV
jgi:hypothetical protein